MISSCEEKPAEGSATGLMARSTCGSILPGHSWRVSRMPLMDFCPKTKQESKISHCRELPLGVVKPLHFQVLHGGLLGITHQRWSIRMDEKDSWPQPKGEAASIQGPWPCMACPPWQGHDQRWGWENGSQGTKRTDTLYVVNNLELTQSVRTKMVPSSSKYLVHLTLSWYCNKNQVLVECLSMNYVMTDFWKHLHA